MVGEVADIDPLSPALAGLPHLVGGLVVGLRRRMPGPAQRDEDVVAFLEAGASSGFPALEADPQVARQLQLGMGVRVAFGPCDGLLVRGPGVLPARADPVV